MEPEKDLRQYRDMFLARKHYFIWPALAVLLVSAFIALSMPSIYESSSTILIEEQQIPPDFVRTTVSGYADQRIHVLNQQILSRTRLAEIIRQFNLYPEMQEHYAQEEIIAKMRNDIKVNLISASDRRDGRRGGGEGVTIAFTIAYQGKNPAMVQRVNGMLTSLYLEENLKIRELHARTTTQFLEAELKGIQERIKNLGEKITDFKARHEGILPELQQFNRAQAENLERQIEQITVQIDATQERIIYLEGQLATVDPHLLAVTSTGERIMDPATRLRVLEVTLFDLQSRYSPNHPDVAKVKREMAMLAEVTAGGGTGSTLKQEKLAQLRAELVEKQGRYTDQHPEVVKLKKEIAELAKRPAETAPALKTAAPPDNPAYINLLTNIQGSVDQIRALNEQKERLEARLSTYRQRLEETPQVEQEYLALTRDYQNAHVKHQEIMDKILEARIAEGMEEAQKAERFTLIDPASYPEKPVSPNRPLIMLAGLVIGLGCGVVMVVLPEQLDHSVKSADELAWLTGLPVLGSMPLIQTAEDKAQKQQRQRLMWALSGAALLAGLLIFHFFFRDLFVLIARLGQLVGKYL
jgi:polysaccharide biosynthesis transport protein